MNPFLEALMSPFTTNQRTRDAFVPSRTGPAGESYDNPTTPPRLFGEQYDSGLGRTYQQSGPRGFVQEGYDAPATRLFGEQYGAADPALRGSLFNALQSPGSARGYYPGMTMPMATANPRPY